MRLLSTCTMENKFLSTRTMANDVAKHKNNANGLLSTITMPNEVAKHKNDAK